MIESVVGHELIDAIYKSRPATVQELFRKLIGKCLVIASIKNEVDESTMGVLYEYTLKNYSMYTFQEIEKAITYNESGMLDERVEHFHSFSLNYLSRVMGNWLVLKNRTRQRIAALLPPVTVKEPTPDDLYQGLLNFINLNNSFPEVWAWSKVYQYMEECLMISESNDEKRAIYEIAKAKENQKAEFELLSVTDFIQRAAITDSLEDRIKVECRKQLVTKHLKHLLK